MKVIFEIDCKETTCWCCDHIQQDIHSSCGDCNIFGKRLKRDENTDDWKRLSQCVTASQKATKHLKGTE
jgi:hypothetical protein